jgi:hypothetical protein
LKNVIILVFDSVSASNFRRYLPKSHDVLQRVYNATVFEGMMKVGDNSLPNAVAFFAGLCICRRACVLAGRRTQTTGFESELPDDMSGAFMDEWPLIWKDYKAANCVTMYAEDLPDYNLFNYLAKGFQRKPVDHYFR